MLVFFLLLRKPKGNKLEYPLATQLRSSRISKCLVLVHQWKTFNAERGLKLGTKHPDIDTGLPTVEMLRVQFSRDSLDYTRYP